jgi:hypothetical protein
MKAQAIVSTLFFSFLLLAACGPATPVAGPDEPETAAAASPAETEAGVEGETAAGDTIESTGAPDPEGTTTPETAGEGTASGETASDGTASDQTEANQSAAIQDDLAARFLQDLAGDDPARIQEALSTIRESGDERFVSVLIELMRGRQIGIVGGPYSEIIGALEELSGQDFGDDWPAWVIWYGGTDLEPPPGFTTWKGNILSRIDPGFGEFLRDEYPSRIRVEEIQWGGVPVDGIPPLEHAPMIPGDEAVYLRDEEPVFGVVANDEARAYPLRIVDNHEMANDTIGGIPVSVAYCTLCGAAIAYDGRASDGNTYDFGTSGFLYRSNKLMYDRPTGTLWNQLTGEPVLGELADTDVRLDILPIVLTSWADWLAQHPDTLVLDRETGVYPADFYESGVLYGDYFASSETMFPVWQRSDLLEDKDFVYALHIDGQPKAYDVRTLAEEQVVNDELGGTPLVLVASRGTVTVDGVNRRVGPVTYTNGGEVRAYDRGEEVFSPGPDADTVLDSSRRAWQVTEEALLGPDGESAPRVNGHLAYWFGWYAFFPNTLLYPEPRG